VTISKKGKFVVIEWDILKHKKLKSPEHRQERSYDVGEHTTFEWEGKQ
jgi:hypothetical protein